MWLKLAGLAAICLTVSGWTAVADEHALVKDEVAAIAIGQNYCAKNHAEVVRQDLSDTKWTARFDAAGGYWWVRKHVSLAPSAHTGNVMGLLVLVNAMSGSSTSCDLEYMAEF